MRRFHGLTCNVAASARLVLPSPSSTPDEARSYHEAAIMKRSMRLLPSLTLLLPAVAARAQAPLYDLAGPPNAEFGHSIASVPDVDGDGHDDLAIGAPRADGLEPDAGRVYISSGRTGATLVTIPGERTGDRFGWSVAGLEDIDGDGAGDLVVGAPWHDYVLGPNNGAAYTISGSNGAQIWKLGGNAPDDLLGYAVAAPGDLNGDGVADYAFSLPYSDQIVLDGGLVWVHSGANHTVIRLHYGQQAGELFGFALDGAGDVNGDGVPDLACGAPRFDVIGGPVDVGRGYVLSGATNGLVLFSKVGSVLTGQFGFSAAGLGDASGDGVPDVAFGEPFFGGDVLGAGRVRTFSGAPPYPLQLTVTGSGDERLGWSIAGLDDEDGDGLGDLLIGAPRADLAGVVDRGRVEVWSPAAGALLHSWWGYFNGDEMGRAVASAGDLNHDGFTDMASGAPLNDDPGTDSGWVRWILGSTPLPANYCVGKLNSHGCVPTISYTGCPSATIGDNFHLHANGVLPNQPGILIWSLGSAATPFMGGTLCLAPSIRRTPAQSATGVGPCGGFYDFHFSQALMAQHGLAPGTPLFAQYWYRDPGLAPPFSVGLTNGIALHVLP